MKLTKMKPTTALYAALLFALVLPAICRRRVEIIEEPDEEESDFNCPEQFGYYPDPTNCSRYHLCDHGKATVKSCDDGLVFSTILKTCDWPYNVHCNLADGDFTGQHLRLRGSEEGKSDNGVDQADQLPTNRRQPVLSAEDDSYWLGRPESTLLSLGDDDDFVDNYHYEEPQRISKPKSIPPRQNRRKETTREEENSDTAGENPNPWFNSLNFDQIRRQEERKPSTFRRVENSNTAAHADRAVTSTTTTPAPANPFAGNGRGGGWRQSQRTRPASRTTTTTELPQLLPRKALRIGNVDEEILSDVDRNFNAENEQNGNQLRRQKEPQESYRLVSHDRTTTRVLPTTLPPAVPEELRPRHLGTSRRRNNRKQNTAPPTTTARPTTVPPTTTQRPWNARPQRNRQEVRIPENAFKQFERRPVLRDSEDAPPRESFDDLSDTDDGLDDAHFYTNPVEIRKKSRVSGDSLSVHIPKDVPNSLDTRRAPKQGNRQQSPPKSNRVDPESIYKAFQAGFRHAAKPTPSVGRGSDDEGNSFRVNPSMDMEYEDVGNEDEDENVEEADQSSDGPGNDDNSNSNKPNKEIVVKYDDDEEEAGVARKPATSRAPVTQKPATFKPFTFTTLPPPTTARRPGQPTPPRLTQFVDIFVHNPDKSTVTRSQTPAPTRATPAAPNTAIQLVDLVSKQQKFVNPTPRTVINFGFAPGLSPNNSLIFFPPPLLPPPISPKQPRHTSTLDNSSNNNFERPHKKPPKVKVKESKKQSKSKKQQPKPALVPKTFTGQEVHYKRAKRCVPELCQPPHCQCSGLEVPGGYSPKDIPQIILLTFDDSVNDLNREIYKKLFEEGRTNPNNCPIRATFYVSHEWTDYSQVQNLYAKGHEMASHSISHSFGEKFSKQRWFDEIAGQREILHLYGGVDWQDVRGMRAPFLQTGGNNMFEMLKEANFTYDSSMPEYQIDPPLFPYTLDYALGHECMIEPCPTSSIPGLWSVGMPMMEDGRGGRCSMADGCFNPPDEEGVYQMLKNNFLRHYNTNRAPFPQFYHSRWFLTEHNMKGFIKFIDEVLQQKDVYVVTNWQLIQWMQRPTPLSHIRNFAPFGCDDIKDRPPMCKAPRTCKVRFRGETRTLRTCSQCPRVYPWTGQNGFQDVDDPRH